MNAKPAQPSPTDRDPDTAHTLRRSNAGVQLAWYILVGGLSFLADLAVFVSMLKAAITVAIALPVGFIVGTIANYLLSLALAFTGGRHHRTGEFSLLVIVALIGLALTSAIVWVLIALGASPILAKIIATPIVFLWNFLGRRLLVFRPDMPLHTWRISARALARMRGGR